MTDVNVEKRHERSLDPRSQSGLLRRGEMGFPSFFRTNPAELFSLNPFTLMRRLTEDMDRMFSGYGRGSGNSGEIGVWAPPVEVPGLNKEDVKVEVTEDAVVIQGERKRESEEERQGIHRSERYYGAFYREIPLPQGAKADQAKAQFNNGLLEVTVPIPEAQRRTLQIPIEGGEERRPVGSQTGKAQTQTSKAG